MASACAPCRESMAIAVDLGRNPTAIWQDLVIGPGFDGFYSSVKQLVRALRGDPRRSAAGGAPASSY